MRGGGGKGKNQRAHRFADDVRLPRESFGSRLEVGVGGGLLREGGGGGGGLARARGAGRNRGLPLSRRWKGSKQLNFSR